jgi:hypothetical protein
MRTLQLRLLGANLLALLTLLTGDIVGATLLTTVGFVGVFLTLGLLAVVTAAALVGGVARSPVSMLDARRNPQ